LKSWKNVIRLKGLDFFKDQQGVIARRWRRLAGGKHYPKNSENPGKMFRLVSLGNEGGQGEIFRHCRDSWSLTI